VGLTGADLENVRIFCKLELTLVIVASVLTMRGEEGSLFGMIMIMRVIVGHEGPPPDAALRKWFAGNYLPKSL